MYYHKINLARNKLTILTLNFINVAKRGTSVSSSGTVSIYVFINMKQKNDNANDMLSKMS